jgi:hypothetical protein
MKTQTNFNFFILLSALILVAGISIIAYAIGTNDVIIYDPANYTWTRDTYSFNVSWQDIVTNVTNATCRLYMATTPNETFLINISSYFNITYAKNGTSFLMPMNNSFPRSGINYWSVECLNTSSTPTSWNTPARIIVFNDLGTNVTTHYKSFTSLTFTNNATLTYKVGVVNLYNETTDNLITCNITNMTGGVNYAGGTGVNGSNITLTTTMVDGNYTLNVTCSDRAGNKNATTYQVYSLDTIAPTISYRAVNRSAVGQFNVNPDDYNVTTNTTLIFNFTVTDSNLLALFVNFSGTVTNITLTNCTTTGPTYNCTYNMTSISKTMMTPYFFYAEDKAGNSGNSETRHIAVTEAGIPFGSLYNWTIVNSNLSWKITTFNYAPRLCQIELYTRNMSWMGRRSGVWTSNGTSSANCTGSILGSEFLIQTVNASSDFNLTGALGNFTMEYNITSALGEVNTTQKVGNFQKLYTGWNMIGLVDTNYSSLTIQSMIKNSTQISWYNNSAKSFTTYSTSTPTVNNATNIKKADAFLVYATENTYFMSNDFAPANPFYINITVQGWNTMAVLNNVNMSGIYNMKNFTGNGSITFASWMHSSDGLFYTCRRSIELCTGTTTNPNNLSVYKGYAVWLLPNDNETINMYNISQGGN